MGWRSKLVLLLIVYCAGFATAVYYLAPTPDLESGTPLQMARLSSALNSQELLKSFNSGMHKCVGFSKEAAIEAAKLLQSKYEEIQKAQSQG